MAKKPKESRHAQVLRELGFEPLSPELEAYVEDRMERRLGQTDFTRRFNELGRKERRLLEKFAKTPTVGMHTGGNLSVHATDDTGKRWIARKAVDISALTKRGFEDITESLRLTKAANLPPPPPRKYN